MINLNNYFQTEWNYNRCIIQQGGNIKIVSYTIIIPI